MTSASGKGKVAASQQFGVIASVDALRALGTIVDMAQQYGQLVQTERTKRAAIAAAESMHVARVQAAEATLKMYFDRVFEERRQTSDEMFVRLDQAMEAGDPQMVNAVVRGLVELAQASPLAGMEDFGKFWSDYGSPENPIEL